MNNLFDYAATYPDAVLRFYKSDMILNVDSDAAYLVLPNAKSRIAGYYHLSSYNPPHPTPLNAPILIICKTIKNVVASAAEAETGGLFLNGQEIIPIRYLLEQMSHPQPPTPLKTDNSTSLGFVTSNIKLKRSKAWDMRFHWLRDRIVQKNFKIYWDRGINNQADYHTKHHPTKHHIHLRPMFLKKSDTISAINILRGCVHASRSDT